jgi:hypothetical protein
MPSFKHWNISVRYTRSKEDQPGQFSPRDRRTVECRANWPIRNPENPFFETKVGLPLIEEMMAVDAGGQNGREPFEPQEFFDHASV